MNSFLQVIIDTGLNVESQGEAGWLYALLKLGAYDYEGANMFNNPAKEVIRRLEQMDVGPHTLAKVRAALNTLEQKYERF